MATKDFQTTYKYNLLKNVHLHLKNPTENGKSFLVKGDYTYFHYGCDGHNDVVISKKF